MSNGSLSIMDHRETEKDDMRYLVQPRGPGKSWVFRMLTPPDLIGLPNPWDGKPLGKEIKKGLATRHLPEARKRRDIALGDIRKLQQQPSSDDAWSLKAALAWREMTEEAQRKQDGEDIVEGYDLVLSDRVEQAATQGVPSATVKRFIRIASGRGYLLTLADPRLTADLRNRRSVFALLDDERLLRVREIARLHTIPLLSQPEKRSGKLQP